MTELLDSILQIGEEMRAKLSENDIESFYSLLGQRQEAIQKLSKETERKSLSPELSEKFSRLQEQFNSIMKDLKQKEQTMLNNLQSLQNLKQAQRSYSFDRRPHQFIRNNVSG